jgi:quercetin dioxygenase-like cupin family protein
MSSNPDIENSWFRSYRIELDPGEETLLQTHRNPTVIIQGTQGTVHVTREDGITAELDMAGDWAWRDANSPFTIQNKGQTSVAVAINEGRE